MRKIIDLGHLLIDLRSSEERELYLRYEDIGDDNHDRRNRKTIRLGPFAYDGRTAKERLEDLSVLVSSLKSHLKYCMGVAKGNPDAWALVRQCNEELKRRREGLPPEYKKEMSDEELQGFCDDMWEGTEIEEDGAKGEVSYYIDELEQLCLRKDLLRARVYKYK